MTGIQN